MKSIDAIKKIPPKSSSRKIVKKKKIHRVTVAEKKVVSPYIKKEVNKSLMWVLVSCFMVVVIVGWVFFLRSSLANDLNTRGGGFDEISKGFRRLFFTVDKKFEEVQKAYTNLQKAQMDVTEEDETDKEVQELREKVFPQFENINTNSNI